MVEIVLQNIQKNFGDFIAVKNSNLKVKTGEFFVMLGPSGCGKTTTLRMIAGLEIPTSGNIMLDNNNVTSLRASQRDIAFVFQLFALYPHLNVEKNISFPLRMQKMKSSEIKERVREVSQLLRIEHLLKSKVSTLAGGDRRRVALGREIVRRPAAFLMDEPLGTLDTEFREKMCLELRKLHNRIQATTVYVTHDQIEALTFADQVVVMHEGQIVQTGTPVELFEKPKHTFVGHFIGSPGMNILPCEIKNGQINFEGKILPSNTSIKKTNFSKTQVGIRPEFINFSNDGIKVKIKRVSDTGRHKVIDTECNSGRIKILANASAEIPSENTHITFDQKYTYVYGDDWIIE